ncbi:MAG TPA: YCF48-related protein [Ignavibacteria bacterium]|jgi:photosystem II stability/assembly factor-like uncharacterized protein
MKIRSKILLLFIVNCSLLIVNCFGQWLQQISGITGQLRDCDFINQNTGWACGDNGVVLKTTNGGVNWIQQNTGVFKLLEGIDAVDANILYSVGWFQTILKSTNGGTNWIIIRDGPTGTGSTFFKCFFLNSLTGWLLRSGGGYVLRTTNGGMTFDSTFTNNSFNRDIYFKDALTGVLCGDGAWVMKSTDGGVTWTQIQLPLLTGAPNLYRLSFVNDYGWTIGEGSESGLGKLVFRTTNFGSSWDSIGRVPYPSNNLNYSVFFSSLNTGYCGGTFGYIFKSTNGGFNWLQQTVPIDGYRGDFWFANDSLGWVVGGGGYILKTTNGGSYVALEPISNLIPKKFNLFQNYPNPFNPVTEIKFALPQNSFVTVKVYDVLGELVAILVKNEFKDAGYYSAQFDGTNLSSGIYFYTIEAGDYKDSKKMILIK